jgi:hypothetical protein
LRQGARPDDIVLVNADPDDLRKLARIAASYGITVSERDAVIFDRLPVGRAFLDASETPDMAWNRLCENERFADPLSKAALSSLAGVLGRYGRDIPRDILAYECSVLEVRLPKRANVVHASDAADLSAFASGTFLVLDAIEGRLPVPAVDDDYLSDAEKELVGLETSAARNGRLRDGVGHALSVLEDVVLFRPLVVDDAPTRPTSVLDGRRPVVAVQAEELPTVLSATEGILAYAKERYDADILGARSDRLRRLSDRFASGFTPYDPSFTPLSEATTTALRTYPISFSATSLETFYRCRFSFLLDHLLRLTPFDDSDAARFGTLVHAALRRTFQDGVPVRTALLEGSGDTAVDPRFATLTHSLALRLETVVARLEDRMSDVEDAGFESEYSLPVEGHPGLVVKGTIDRVVVSRRKDGNYVFVIDYKTGSPRFSREDFERGTDIQPVFYLHLLRFAQAIPEMVPAGFYYQPVSLGRMPRTDGKDPVADALKLDGLTLADPDIVATIGGPGALRNVRVKNDGTFHAGSSVADRETLEKMIGKIDVLIAEAVDAVMNGSFPIDAAARHPGKESESCRYCVNRDVCHAVDRIPEEVPESDGEAD